ncbi:MAG: hypothetical protein LAT57_01415 [Balneolales bacterium]|nr:hypothetical protein [Balneolales bacterium]
MDELKQKKNWVRGILVVVVLALYFLPLGLVNPFIVITILPVYVGYPLVALAWRKNSIKLEYAAYGFLLVSLGFSLFYHVQWLFDIGGVQTSSSTSIFLFFFYPFIAVIFGLLGYLAGLLAGFFVEYVGKQNSVEPEA